jgi:hypothetical protein
MSKIYRTRIDNREAFKSQVFSIFTNAYGDKTAEDFTRTLYGKYTVEDFNYSDDSKYLKVLDYFKEVVIPHKIAVYEAGIELSRNEMLMKGVNKSELLDNLWTHDMSKFSANESFGYAFYNRKTGDGKDEFELAWHHHKQHNPHHPEYWFSAGRDGLNTSLDIPRIYLIEMVADWIGAGKTYGNLLEDWLPENISRFRFSSKTANELHDILSEVITGLHFNVITIDEDGFIECA